MEIELSAIKRQMQYANVLRSIFGLQNKDIRELRCAEYGRWYVMELDRIRSMSQKELALYTSQLYTQVHSILPKDKYKTNNRAICSLYTFANNLLFSSIQNGVNSDAYISVER